MKAVKAFYSTVLPPSLIVFLDLVGIGGEVGMAELEDLDYHDQGDYIPRWTEATFLPTLMCSLKTKWQKP